MITAVQVAESCAEAVRDLARVTHPEDGAPGLEYPGDVFVVLGLLARSCRDLPAGLEHLELWLSAQAAAGRLEVSGAPEDHEAVVLAVAAMRTELLVAMDVVQTLAASLTAAQTSLRDLRQA